MWLETPIPEVLKNGTPKFNMVQLKMAPSQKKKEDFSEKLSITQVVPAVQFFWGPHDVTSLRNGARVKHPSNKAMPSGKRREQIWAAVLDFTHGNKNGSE